VANDGTRGTGNGLLYGIIGALCVVVAGGGFYQASQAPLSPQQAANPAPVAAPSAAPAQAAPKPAPTGPSASQLTQARQSIADARRLAMTGNFTEAETALESADRVIPGFAETAAARREIADMRTARAQNDAIGPVITRVRQAIARGDLAAAHRALEDAERINPNAPEVVEARRQLRAAERPDTRIASLVASAKAAIARHDYGAADRALDEAERIDGRDPAVIQTRNELLEAAARSGRPPSRN